MASHDVEKWLNEHHRVDDDNRNHGGQEIHVFAVEKGPVFGGHAGEGKCYDISFSLGPVTFTIEICIDIKTGRITICLYVKIPLLPKHKLGCATGSIKDGVTITFDWKIVSGTFKFYVKDGWLWVHYDVKILGKHYTGDLKLIPLPFLSHGGGGSS
ncbi:hypothetical protein E1B28_003571 [Marasmius oreades]|uniref:Uncharacterized protein n=1 Tax=Marasmius oreades TaxID=181124 RepID=A0A9P7RMU8_9AGAR|nr:uncharacterized protein E1B28_003571 [Marasmius oreades]KAG7086050.1 hypothetical protein E1B28_003571 [Marasmius oreades]